MTVEFPEPFTKGPWDDEQLFELANALRANGGPSHQLYFYAADAIGFLMTNRNQERLQRKNAQYNYKRLMDERARHGEGSEAQEVFRKTKRN